MEKTRPAGDTARQTAPVRRSPSQARSRERVEGILEAASELVVEHGVDGLTTKAIAARTGTPVASIYQYFSDKDAILMAMVERDTQEMDAQVATALGALPVLTLRSIIEATMLAFVSVCRSRPSFVVIWGRGRTNAAVAEYCRANNSRVAQALHDFAVSAGLVPPGVPPQVSQLAVALGDRVIEVAFAEDLHGDEEIIRLGIDLIAGSLDRFATPAGLTGIPNTP